MAEALAEATELMTRLLLPELDTDKDEPVDKELLPDRVEDVNEDGAATEDIALAEGDDPGRLVELSEAVEDTDERLVDVEADPEVEVTEAVAEPEFEEVLPPSSPPSSSSVMVEVGDSPPSVIVISSSSPLDVETGMSSSDIELGPLVGVLLEDGMSMAIEVTLVVVELATADDDIAEDDCVVVVVVAVGPIEVVLPGMRLR